MGDVMDRSRIVTRGDLLRAAVDRAVVSALGEEVAAEVLVKSRRPRTGKASTEAPTPSA
ncbi:hypothetical protein [Streptomyces sp. NPDC059957]|uniref:hypothetical protein n=1 Tax=Streptomyces sp. NPDC059957 TaxID=3347016 RepID=UPI00365C414A